MAGDGCNWKNKKGLEKLWGIGVYIEEASMRNPCYKVDRFAQDA